MASMDRRNKYSDQKNVSMCMEACQYCFKINVKKNVNLSFKLFGMNVQYYGPKSRPDVHNDGSLTILMNEWKLMAGPQFGFKGAL